MIPIILALALLFVPQTRPPRNGTPAGKAAPNLEQRVIATVQKTSAKALDPELPDQPFAEWFQSVVGKDAKVEWESNDCGEQTGDPKTTPVDFPICGQASAKLSGARVVTVMVAVGSHNKGITAAPSVFFIGIDIEATFEPVQKLHDLPAALAKSAGAP
jgi:hypothetical protein